MRGRFTFVFFIYCLMVFPFALMAQDITVTGKVTDQKEGLPLPGVTVKVEGSNRAVSTDGTGRFSIQAANGSRLTFSLIGMASQTVTITSSTVNVSLLTDAKELSEVVVVGYGTQKKSVVTGAISSVKASDLENQPVVRIEQSLQGRTSGLTIAATSGQPGSSATVRLRGFTSFGNDKNNPLWVVDGVVIDNGGIGYLNQADIESIEVLKDAASAAIYGARAASGVILVTTKKGKAGNLSITYSGYYGTQAPAKKLDLLNATEYATVRNTAAINAGKAAPYPNAQSYGEGTDWQSLIFNNSAPKQNHEVSISGGSEKATFYTSFGYTDIDGIVATPISKFNRANVRLNSTYKPAKWITIGENLGYSHAVNSGIGETNREYGGVLSSAVNLDPIMPAIISDAASAATVYNPNNPLGLKDANGNFYGVPAGGFQEMKNPLAYIQTRLGNYSWDHNIIGNGFVDVEPIAGLHVRSTLGTKMAFYGGDSFTPVFFLGSGPGGSNLSASLSRNLNYVINYNFENTISYNRIFDKHNITLLVGQGAYKDGNARGVSTTYANIPATTFDEASFRYNTLPANRTTSGNDGTDHKVNSLFSRLQYNYAEKYLMTALIRRDGSSRFGQNNKFGYFPSASVGWVPTLEDFFPKNNIVSFLKIRASYGVTGQDLIGDFSFVPTVGPGRNYTFGSTEVINVGYSPNAPANPDLKWEETRQTDIGFDAVLFRDFTFGFDWYKKKTIGILQNPPVPGYTGSGAFAANVADMQNTGVEFELGYRKQFGELNVSVNANASFFKNEVTKLLPGVTFIDDNTASFQTLGGITRTALGRSYNEFFGYQNLGIFQTQAEIDSYVGPSGTKLQPNAKPGDFKFANLNGDNAINGDDRTYLGNPAPKASYGLTINLAYKNFDFSAFGSGVAGNTIFQGLRRLDIGTQANWQTKILDSWTPTNTSATLPRLVEGDPNGNYSKFNSVYLEKGDYFRLRTIQLGYSFPKSITSKLRMQKLRVYVLSENLFTITKYSGYDPELGVTSDAGGGAVFSIDRSAYPQARSFLFGLNVGF
ncbi:SusC/RagA family TonB-linked outer membrane protein [Pedobacter punctiformis]|uniref:TonB-dependent receptor n=1 Tax=Pedobacter punctiformis TaxID=3004097 RepID=A0ABT4LBL7_9SPHI|nr:TonB-dependent receptor [Pedobacter sp. HCMS5-2]MCZ4245310.1 TonB-dependent receptor [Pedobacter sp. HCMS5-2]